MGGGGVKRGGGDTTTDWLPENHARRHECLARRRPVSPDAMPHFPPPRRLASAKAMSAAVDASLDPADYTPWGNYALSKAANVLFTKELQRRMTRAGVKGSAVALHPGGKHRG